MTYIGAINYTALVSGRIVNINLSLKCIFLIYWFVVYHLFANMFGQHIINPILKFDLNLYLLLLYSFLLFSFHLNDFFLLFF